MPRFLFKASYTPDGVKGVIKDGGTARRDAIAKLTKDLGGNLETFDFAFGDADVYTICELPDNETATAIAMAVNGSGAVTLQTTVLMTPEEVDAAAKKSIDYHPPGS